MKRQKGMIKETLALEMKNMKTIHTFNVKANRGAGNQFSGIPFGKKPGDILKISIFQNKSNIQAKQLFPDSSKRCPMLTIGTTTNLNSNLLYSDSSDEEKKIKIEKINKNKKSGKSGIGKSKKNMGILKLVEPKEKDMVRKRVKTNEFQRKIPLPLKRANTMALSLKNVPKKQFKTTNQIMDFWKNKIDEEDKIEEEEDSSRSLKRKPTKNQSNLKKSAFDTSILNEDSQKSNKKSNVKKEGEYQNDYIEDFKRKFRSENVLDQMGRQKSKIKFSAIKISDFEVIRELGKGHFGKVLLVRRKTTQDEFAVKLIPMQRSLDQKDQENLSSEAQIFRMISSQFVVKAYYW